MTAVTPVIASFADVPLDGGPTGGARHRRPRSTSTSPRPPPRTATPPTSWTGPPRRASTSGPVYVAADRDAVVAAGYPLDSFPGAAAVHPRAVPDDVRQPAVDHPPVRRLLHRRGVQRVLPPQPGRGPEGSFGGVRPGHPPRLRLRPSTRGGRRRNGRGGNRFDPRHAAAVRRHRPVGGVGVDDDERCRAADPGAVRRGRRGAGRAAGEAGGDHPERHPQGVHGPQHLHLSARSRRCGSSPTSSATPA